MTARKTQSWDDFWAEQSGGRTEVIRGVKVQVPTDMPLGYENRVADLKHLGEDSGLEEFAELVDPLFGPGVFEQWVDTGMGQIELLTAVTWGMAQASRKDLSFAEAFELVTSNDPGKAVSAPNRAARRAASKSPSKSTGGRSKPTSSASTASARKTSRG